MNLEKGSGEWDMDTSRRDALIQAMEAAERTGDGFLLVSLDDFFVGNDQFGSICPHVIPQPHPSEVFAVFEAIRQNTSVGGVYVMPTQIDRYDEWPFSDTIWIITSLSLAQLEAMIPMNFLPSEWLEGWPTHFKCQERFVPEGMRPIAAWYD
ncbi:MAG: hypothetical protein ABL901_02160 [Hyphomicrobiaceae bacterium]